MYKLGDHDHIGAHTGFGKFSKKKIEKKISHLSKKSFTDKNFCDQRFFFW